MYVDTSNPKSRPDGHYSSVIQQIAEDGVCPFCPEHLSKYHPNPIEERKHWLLTDNAYPYKPKKHHRLLIHKTHIQHFNEISPEAWQELREIINEETGTRNITGGSQIMRFGETRFTGASVTHLHAHLLQSDPDSPEYDPKKGVIMRVG